MTNYPLILGRQILALIYNFTNYKINLQLATFGAKCLHTINKSKNPQLLSKCVDIPMVFSWNYLLIPLVTTWLRKLIHSRALFSVRLFNFKLWNWFFSRNETFSCDIWLSFWIFLKFKNKTVEIKVLVDMNQVSKQDEAPG